MAKDELTSFYRLDPNDVMNAVEEAGFRPTGEFQQLNSYENRVFDIHLEEVPDQPKRLIAKFYRPARWSKEALLDEHGFLFDLEDEGVTAIAPYTFKKNQSLLEFAGMYISFFPRFAGRMPQEFLVGDLKQVGHNLARLHNVGAQRKANHRPNMYPDQYGWDDLDLLSTMVDRSLWPRYQQASATILEYLEDHLNPNSFLRIHGDCHRGNLLNDGKDFFFVDFDDFLNGPAAQDFWMLFSGGEFFAEERDEVLEGYEDLRSFPADELKLFEPLRGLRIIHYGAWIARRWDDPSFPRLFPDFGSYHYWAEETEALEKISWAL